VSNGSERLDRLRELYDQSVHMSADERRAFLDALGGEDAALRPMLESMLDQEASALTEISDDDDTPTITTGLSSSGGERVRIETGGRVDRIGPYKILHEIGRGGMGTVYAGVREDSDVIGRVAIKIISKGRDTDNTVRRFKQERRVLSGLVHPNIARFLDGGETEDGRAYFVMEYVEGVPIDQYCDSNNLSVRERIELFSRVCGAVQYAHTNLIVHRDLKPHNILVTAQGEPKLLDFGIAKILNPNMQIIEFATGLEQRLLTPEYASPEQVRGEPLTTRSDVYSLGVLLYELLCGKRPYEFKARLEEEIVRIVTEFLPERPSTFLGRMRKADGVDTMQRLAEHRGTRPDPLVRQISGELDDIIMHALQKPPDKRYESAGAMGEDLSRFIRGETVDARRTGNRQIYRLRKFYQRRRMSVTVSAVAAALVLMFGAVSLVQWRNARLSEIEELRSSLYAEAVWEQLMDSGVDIRLPVDDRQKMYASILASFERIGAESESVSDATLLRRARVLRQLASTAFSRRGSSSLDTSEAEGLLARAESDLDAMRDPDPVEARFLRISILRDRADIAKSRGAGGEAIDAYERVIENANAAARVAQDPRIALLAARNANSARRSIAGLHADACRLDEASVMLGEAVDEASRMRREHPDDARLDRDWTVALYAKVYSDLDRDDLGSTLDAARAIVSMRRRFHENDTGSPRAKRDLATGLLALADVHAARSEHADAVVPLDEAASLLRLGMEISDGEDERMRETLAIVLLELGVQRALAGDPEGARGALVELETVGGALRNGRPRPGELVSIRAGAHHLRSLIDATLGDMDGVDAARDRVKLVLAESAAAPDILALRIEYDAELIGVLPAAASAVREGLIADARAAIERLDALGRSCLVPERIRRKL